MVIFNCILTETKKAVASPSFLFCCAISFVMFFTANCYTDASGKEYSIFEVMTTFTSEELSSSENYSSWNILSSGLNATWLHMFVPIIAAFPFIPVFCDERSGGGIRYSVLRMGKWRYNLSKFISALISGGLGITLGYALFGAVIAIAFPSLSSYDSSLMEWYNQIYFPNGVPIALLSLLSGVFLYGAFFSLIAFSISSFVRNKYLVMCIPFMLKYMYDQIIQKLSLTAASSENYELYEKLTLFQTYTLLYYTYYTTNILIGYGVVAAVFLGVFVLVMNRRFDLGA